MICMPAVLVAVALFAVNNPSASAWLLNRAAAIAPGSLVLEEIRGDLVSGLTIGSLRYALPQVRIDATDARIGIDWTWAIESRLAIDRLTARRLQLTFPDNNDQPHDGSLPAVKLPLAIDLNDAHVNELLVSAPGLDERLEDVALRAKLNDSRIVVLSLNARRGDLTADVAGDVELTGRYPLNIRIDWRLDDTDFSGSGSLSGNLETLTFDQRINIPDSISASGNIYSVLLKPRVVAIGSWTRIELPMGDGELTTLTAGRASLNRDLSRFEIQLSTDVKMAALPTLSTTLSATGNLQQLEISRLLIEGFDGRIDGTGLLDLVDRQISLRLAGRNLNPGTVFTELPGQLNANATIEAKLPDRVFVQLESVTGTLIGQELSGRARLTMANDQLKVSGLYVDAGDNHVEFDGNMLPRLTGRFAVDARDLAQLSHDLRGQIQGNGDIAGTWEEPVAHAELRATGFSYRDQGAEQLLIRATIDEDQIIDALIRADDVAIGETSVGDVATTVSGRLGAQIVAVEVSGGPIDLSVNATGGWNGTELSYQLNSATADSEFVGAWQLRSPFELRAGESRVGLSAHCWEQNTAALCIGDSWADGDSLSVEGYLKNFPLTAFQRWTQEGLSISGSADAEFQLDRQKETLAGRLSWIQKGTRIEFNDSADTTFETIFDEVEVEIAGSSARAEVTGRIHNDLGVSVDLNAVLTDLLAEEPGINGNLRVLAPDIGDSIALINRYFDVRELKGRLDADLRAEGPLATPRITGTGNLTDGSASLPLLGIDVEDIQLSLNGQNDSPTRLTASATSGGGKLSIDGVLDVSEQTGPFADLRVRGENFQIIRSPNQTVHVSPDLNSRIDEGRIDISGIVVVPMADIRIEALPESVAKPSADIIVVSQSEKEPSRRSPLEIVADLELRLGDDVRFAGFGIDTHLTGGLNLTRAAGAVNSYSEGNLRAIDGAFEAYRKKLTIDRGTLIFGGSLNDPVIDARASRELVYDGETIKVGVLLSGPLSNIRSKIFSDPAMGEADALSYLVLNRPINRAEGSEQTDLSAAAITFGLSQALPFTQKFQENLGLDEVSLDGADTQSTAIVAGKRLSEDVYIRYSYGLFNRIGTFIVRYDLKRGFVIEAGSGEEQTLDLIYSIQR